MQERAPKKNGYANCGRPPLLDKADKDWLVKHAKELWVCSGLCKLACECDCIAETERESTAMEGSQTESVGGRWGIGTDECAISLRQARCVSSLVVPLCVCL